MGYDFNHLEKKWQKYWSDNKTFKADINHDKPKFFVLDMFPYPSGAGLHVGHPLGYIASDIYARYKRHKGFNVLHPMGYDAYGLPAEQYAIQTGTHPEITTEKNIARYREQLDKIGFSFDWDREVRTSDPHYYKWTQWTFIRLFHSWYNKKTNKAEDISTLIARFEINGNSGIEAATTCEETFTADFWKHAGEKKQQQILMHYRLAYLSETMVNWCPALGTVLANDEVKEGLSERGGHPVEKKLMMQWSLRITAYAQRLLDGLETVDWPEPIKEMQRNWIGRSEGASVDFEVEMGDGGNGNDAAFDTPPQPSPKGRELSVDDTSNTKKSPEVLPLGEDLGGVHPEDLGGVKSEEKTAFETPPHPDNYRDSPKGREQEVDDESNPKFYGTDKNTWFANRDAVRELRKNPTEAESILWEAVRKNQIGYRIRRQHAIDNFIVDFVCLSKQTIIEIDGEIHDFQTKEDKNRTEILEENGFTVIRYKNKEVKENLEDVVKSIKSYLDNKIVSKTPPQPSPKGREQEVDDTSNSKKNPQVLPLGEDLGGVKKELKITVFTTRPDTLFGATFMVLAPEHELVTQITTPDRKDKVEAYVAWAKNRSERERMTEVKNISGEFTGAYGINPLTGGKLPIWIADYVLAGYGTGAIMAVPGHDSRDFAFARHFQLPIVQVVVAEGEEPTDPATWEDSIDSKEGIMVNSGFITGLPVKEAIKKTINKIVEMGIGFGTINFRLRDAIFSRQRYWGEPFPIYYKDGMPYTLDESELPLKLPKVDSYLPTEMGDPPLARAENWKTKDGYPLETNTMPGFAGSSGYYLRYMDPHNTEAYFSAEANQYWRKVDLYIGGDEHAAGHLIYSRFWNKFLFDIGLVCEDEPYKKLINQGKIQGRSSFVYRIQGTNTFVSLNLRNDYDTQRLHVDIDLVVNDVLNTKGFKAWRKEFADAEFILEDGKYICGWEVEKMSKSKHNVQNPDALIDRYGADTLRLYEMFLGPLEQDKPWDTNGIEGVFRFLKKLWRLYFNMDDQLVVTNESASAEELKVLHKTIKKINEDIERFSFNTGVSAFMICVNELNELQCHKREILEPLVILLEPYAPHVAEELWHSLGYHESVSTVDFPQYDEKYLKEASFQYPVSFNGKVRFKLELPADMGVKEIEQAALASEDAKKWMEDKPVRKIIVVHKRIINIVI